MGSHGPLRTEMELVNVIPARTNFLRNPIKGVRHGPTLHCASGLHVTCYMYETAVLIV
jgi:hypothetical protein